VNIHFICPECGREFYDDIAILGQVVDLKLGDQNQVRRTRNCGVLRVLQHYCINEKVHKHPVKMEVKFKEQK